MIYTNIKDSWSIFFIKLASFCLFVVMFVYPYQKHIKQMSYFL